MRATAARLLGLTIDHSVARAQIEALQQRVPYLYAIVAINIVALATTHYGSNPGWQVLLIPAVLVGAIGYRLVWWARLDPATLADDQVETLRRATIRLSGVIGGGVLIWAMLLHGADAALRGSAYMTPAGHVDFFVGITVVSCIFLLMHVQLAALLLASVVIIPFSLYLLATGRMIETAIALNLLLVSAAMMYVAFCFARDFERMVSTSRALHRMSTQNASLAASDAMTGLPNRRRFFERLAEAGAAAAPFAVIAVDLDGFKQVNDIYGHNAGDEVLRGVAARLRENTPDQACLARLGGDEFACLLTGDDVARAEALAAALIAACSLPLECDSFVAKIGASAGICLSDAGADTPMAVYERADYALLQAKRAGRGRIERFSGAHDASIRREIAIAQLLRSAGLLGMISVVFQPIISAASGSITSFEALVRLSCPELGPVGPGEFIPIAERTDLIFDISHHVLRIALSCAASWPAEISVKINLSVRDLLSRRQTVRLIGAMGEAAIHPSRIMFEVTETIFAESLAVVRANIDLLRAAGCRIAIDDFGVGYSSLNYIHALSPDVIKIDRCFVHSIATDSVSKRIVRTIIELARNVGARSIAEGVETGDQAAMLAELGCDELQGFHICRPVPPEQAARMIAGDTPRGISAA